MLWDSLKWFSGVACCAMLVACLANAQEPDPSDAAVAQDTPLKVEVPEMRNPQSGDLYPPPTFFAPPARGPHGRLIIQPTIPPGVPPGAMPQVIWQNSDEMREVIKPSDHWVGVQCGRMNAALRAQLGLGDEQGVLVEAVVEDSPAVKAGIEKYDVLVKAGDRKLTKVQDLIDEVDEVKNEKLSIELIRKGKKKTVEVTPENRPEAPAVSEEPSDELTGEWNKFFDYMQQWEPGKDGRPAMKFRFWRQPGTILPSEPKPADKLPGNVKIEISKQGDKPAEINITRGDESWTVKEGELGQLPEDLRPHIERMLGKPKKPIGWPVIPPEGFKVPNPMQGREGMFEKRFEDVNRRFDRIEKSLKELFDKPEKAPVDEPKEKPKEEAKPKAPKLKPSSGAA